MKLFFRRKKTLVAHVVVYRDGDFWEVSSTQPQPMLQPHNVGSVFVAGCIDEVTEGEQIYVLIPSQRWAFRVRLRFQNQTKTIDRRVKLPSYREGIIAVEGENSIKVTSTFGSRFYWKITAKSKIIDLTDAYSSEARKLNSTLIS